MKKMILLNLVGLLVTPVLVAWLAGDVCAGTYSGGTGEPNDPYRIATANDLNDIGNHIEDFNKCFVMVNDINLANYTGTQFNIIGGSDDPFIGVFDGNGFQISNFSYQTSGSSFLSDYIGLFAYVDDANAEIKNLGLVDANVSDPCADEVPVFGFGVGCLVGTLENGTVCGCYAARSNVRGQLTTGGLVGYNSFGTIADCYVVGDASGKIATGGLAGWNEGTILNSRASGSVVGGTDSGGLVGKNLSEVESAGAIISGCYTTGSVCGDWGTGGLVGDNRRGTVINSYAMASVDGNDFVGGLVGTNFGIIFKCYAAGVVDANTYAGGLVGAHESGFYVRCFWDRSINPGLTGIGTHPDPPQVIGATTARMQMERTFRIAGWDFVRVWDIGEHQTYPFLRRYPVGDLGHDSLVNMRDFAILAGHWLEEK